MKKFFSLLIAVLLVSLVSATDIAYVVKNPDTPQKNVINAIEDLGLSYELIDDSQILTTDFSDYEMILVWDDIISNSENLPILQKKSLVANTYYLEKWKIAEYAGSQVSTGIPKAEVYQDNRITEGVPSIFEVYDKKGIVLNFLPHAHKRAPGLERAVVTDTYQEYPIIGIINPGQSLYGGGTSKERIAFFGIIQSDHWTRESEILFKNTLEWTMYGGDGDHDGFLYDDDCNDSNAEINPDADEIPYNGLDDDCDGEDLVDVDMDGHDSWQVGGEDCDDDDALIGPFALPILNDGIDQNCEGDAPKISEIPGITLEEDFGTYVVDLTEFENDDEDYESYLKWSIKDFNGISVEVTDPDYLITLTSEKDDICMEGCGFTLRLTDSDGMYDEVYVEVLITPVNDAPECEIVDLEWEEDGTAELDLGMYCSDTEGDNLTYGIYETSSSDGIYIESFDSGIIVFSSQENWNGEDWIIFSVSDGFNELITNKVNLTVLPVNDAPECEIPNWEWGEDKTAEINLGEYCSDIDEDTLEYYSSGNTNITIIINDGIASLIPDKDWYGKEEVSFFASDWDFTVLSLVNLTVLEMNEPPEFLDLNCSTELLEDIGEECEVDAWDFENDDYWFSVSGENNLECYFEGSTLRYVSYPDYEGDASCILRVDDEYGYTETELIVSITGINDAPRMTYSPNTDTVRIIEGRTELFEVEMWDVENDIIARDWFLSGEWVGEESFYLFNETIGDYELEIVANDGQETRHKWDVRVGKLNEFTCEEVKGFVCEGNEMCYGNDILDVKGEGVCCQVECQPKFEDIERCENVDSGIEITIEEPDAGEEFMIGETIEVDVKVKNNLNEDIDVDLDAYFYDLSEDEIIDEDGEGLDIKEDSSEDFSFEFKVEEDLDTKNDYAIFVKVNGNYCQEKFVRIKVEREDEDVVIRNIEIMGEMKCEGYIDMDIKVKNVGDDEQEVKIKVENPELGIQEESSTFELDEYGKRRDEKEESFSIKLPEEAKGDYKLLVKVLFNGGERRNEQEISIKCEQPTVREIKSISLSSKENIKENEEKNNNRMIILAITIVTTILVVVVIVYLLYVMFKR